MEDDGVDVGSSAVEIEGVFEGSEEVVGKGEDDEVF